jgi:hypothetical protein
MRTTGGIKAHAASTTNKNKFKICIYVVIVSNYLRHEQHLSTEKYYTSDYDLSKFVSNNQYGLGLTYTDIFTQSKIFFFEINRFTTESLRKKRWTISKYCLNGV